MTKLPDESDGNVVQASRWNVILDKTQDGADTDVTIRGRKATFGTVVSLSAASFVGLSGAAGYYGVRADPTSGDGTASDPYNASAIETAINALGGFGGIVFVKAGVWGRSSESRIQLGGPSQAGRGKSVIVRGEGAHLTNQWKNSGTESAQVGTHIRIGFDIIANKCQVSFENIQLSPHVNAMNSTPTLKYIRDGGDAVSSSELNRTLGGVFLRDIRFWKGHPAIWWTGDRLPLAESSTGNSEVCQFWNILVERCAFIEGGQGIKADEGDSDTANGNFWAVIRDCMFQHRAAVNARTLDIQYTNISLMMQNVMFESVAQAATDYVIHIVGSNGDGSIISEVFTGDGANAIKDAKFSFSIKGPIVRNFRFRKDVDLTGHGDYHMGRAGGTGVVNITGAGTSGQGGIILRRMGRLNLTTGTLNNPENVLIDRRPLSSSEGDHIGNTTPGASPYTFTNTDARMIEAHLVGGTVSDVSRNGQSIGTNRVITLIPGKSIVITYSSAPTIKRFAIS